MLAPQGRGDGILHDVTARATVDLDFRTRLLRDPSGTIKEEFGVTIPTGHQIRFIEKPAGVDTLIVLPDFHPAPDELDEDDLDQVAGGTGCVTENSTAW